MKKIAFIGLGNMGSPLCQRLLLKYNVDIFDINKSNLKPLETLGGKIVKDLQTIANNDYIFLCLPTSDIVESLILGDKGLAKHLKKGTSIIDMTTGEPNITRKIENILSKKGINFVDAPVSGGPKGALNGTIAIMAGCKDDHYEKINLNIQKD